MSPSRLFAGLIVGALLAIGGGAAMAAEGLCPGVAFDLVLDPPKLGYVPFVMLDLAGQHGLFMVDTGATLSSANIEMFGDERYDGEPLRGFSLPGTPEAAFYRRPLRNGPEGRPVLGIIGLDLLIPQVVELHYDAPTPFLVIGEKPCPRERLAGFVPIDQAGYFSTTVDRVAPDLANVPVVFMRIGDVSVPAQLDSGFADAGPGVFGRVQANDALLLQLRKNGVALSSAGTTWPTNCSGKRVGMETWTIDEKPLEITTAGGGGALFSYPGAVLARKPQSECGGIGGYAQRSFGLLGASYMKNWGTIVIDPSAETVWLHPSTPN